MTYIICEAGTTHYAVLQERRFNQAKLAIIDAKRAGADAIKWQMFVPDEPLFCPMEGDDKRWDRWNNTLLTLEQWKAVKAECDIHNIDFLASVFQMQGIEWLKELEPKYYKVASRAVWNYPYELVSPGPFLISMGDLEFRKEFGPWPQRGEGLDCVMKYPAPLNEAMWEGESAGLSDHSGTVWPGLDAIARGADFLEVHFCPDGTNPGNDAPVCLNFNQLKLLCDFNKAEKEMA